MTSSARERSGGRRGEDTSGAPPDLERMARFLDEAFTVPGTRLRIGWDGILGLIPGVGDLVTTVPALWIVIRAVDMGVPRPVLARMIANIGLELVVGAIPLVGDLFDFAWKANLRNLRLLARYRRDPAATRRRSTGALVLAAVVVAGVAVLLVALPLLILAWLIDALGLGAG